MSLKLNSSGGGSITLQEPSTASNRTLTLPDNTGTVVSTASTGVISQAMMASGVAGTGPAFSATTTTAQTIANSTFTKVAYNIETFDTNSCYDPTTNYRFTPNVAGYYQINGNASMGGGSVGYVQCAIYKNGSQLVSGSAIPNNGTVGGMVTASSVVYLNGSSDYVEFYIWQNQGSSINLQTATGFNTFSGALVRAT